MIRVGIVGASGYTASELIRLLVKHPDDIRISVITSETYTGQRIAEVMPNLYGLLDLRFEPLDIASLKGRVDFVFLAVPHKVAMSFAPRILDLGLRVIDFSADYRLKDVQVYEAWYKTEHTSPELLSKAVYGLPELHRDEIRSASLVANPGCYPTGAILAVVPLLANGLVETEGIVVDSKSGISGAGSKPGPATHFPNREGNVMAYNVAQHRHTPEIEQELTGVAGTPIQLNFTPHLIPMSRGILSTLYLKLKQPSATQALLNVYRAFYADEPFVRVLEEGRYPQTHAVYASNFCDVGLQVDPRTNRVVAISAIDNLVKGASGAALQNLNLLAGLDETAGLDAPGIMP